MDDYCMRSFQALPYPSLPYPLALFGLNGSPEYSLLDYQSESNLGFFLGCVYQLCLISLGDLLLLRVKL